MNILATWANDFLLHLQIAWGAFKNMMRAVARDPVWALATVATSPIRLLRYIVGCLVVFLGIGMIFLFLENHLPAPLFKIVNFLGGIAGLILVFRFIVNPMILHFGTDEEDALSTHGTARFANDKEIAPLTKSAGGVLIGRDPKSSKPLRYDGPAHLLTIAPTRTGKGVGTVIPNLLTLDRSIVCVDPKGDNTRVAGRARNRFGPVHVLDPFGVTGVPSSSFNPVGLLDPAGIDVAEDAATLADALVYDAPGETGEAHWNDEAKALIAGVLLYIVAEEAPERRTLATLREYLTLAPDAFFSFLEKMQASKAAGGLAARAANRHLGKSDREATGVLSAAQRHTHSHGGGMGQCRFLNDLVSTLDFPFSQSLDPSLSPSRGPVAHDNRRPAVPNSHTVADLIGSTNIPRSRGKGLKWTKPFFLPDFQAICVCGSSPWIAWQ